MLGGKGIPLLLAGSAIESRHARRQGRAGISRRGLSEKPAC
jgi:hypothetical protein